MFGSVSKFQRNIRILLFRNCKPSSRQFLFTVSGTSGDPSTKLRSGLFQPCDHRCHFCSDHISIPPRETDFPAPLRPPLKASRNGLLQCNSRTKGGGEADPTHHLHPSLSAFLQPPFQPFFLASPSTTATCLPQSFLPTLRQFSLCDTASSAPLNLEHSTVYPAQ